MRRSNVHLTIGRTGMSKRHARGALPGHEAEDEDQDKTRAHGEGEQGTSPSNRREHHRVSAEPEVDSRAKERREQGDDVCWR